MQFVTNVVYLTERLIARYLYVCTYELIANLINRRAVQVIGKLPAATGANITVIDATTATNSNNNIYKNSINILVYGNKSANSTGHSSHEKQTITDN